MLPDFCSDCVKQVKKVKCSVLTEPFYFQEKYGECFSKSIDPDFFKTVKEEVKKYAEGLYG